MEAPLDFSHPLSQALPTPVTTPPPTPPEPIGTRTLASRLQGFLFISPALAVLAIFLIYPAYYTIRLSFYDSDFLFRFTHAIGLHNFKDLLTNDPDFLDRTRFHGFNIVKELVYKSD